MPRAVPRVTLATWASACVLALAALAPTSAGAASPSAASAAAASRPVDATNSAPTNPACVRPVVQRVVQLRAADGRPVPGVLMHPSTGPDPYSPAIVLLHGGPFGHAIRTQSAARFGAEGLACRGYTALSILSRHAGGYYSTRVEDGTHDLAAAVDWLAGFGFGDVVFAGHSFGSVRMSLYLAERKDPRVRALVHYGPTRGSKEYVPRTFAPGEYDEQVRRLRAMVQEGRGDEPTYIEFNYPPPAPRGARFGYVMTASTWLDWWGPESVAQNLELMPRLRVPMLLITGGSDMFVTPDYQQQLAKAATASPRVDTRVYEGAGHELWGAEKRAVDDTAAWLESLGLGVRPRVRTRLVDVEVVSGRTEYGPLYQAGVLYEPEGDAPARGPAVLLTYDRHEDVLTGRLEDLAPRLAQRGYRVLVPQDRSYALNVDRIDAAATDEDFATWVQWLAAGTGSPVVIVGPGWGGERAAGYLARRGTAGVAALALLDPLPEGAEWARAAIGERAYAAAVQQASAARAEGRGGRTLVAAPDARGEYVVRHLADAFLAQYGPDRVPLRTLVAKSALPVFVATTRADGPSSATVAALVAGGRPGTTLDDADPARGSGLPAIADALDRWLQGLHAPRTAPTMSAP